MGGKQNKLQKPMLSSLNTFPPGAPKQLHPAILQFRQQLAQYDQAKPKTVADFPKGAEWINTRGGLPLSLSRELANKIVVIDFWSSCCINCIHVLAEMKELEETFKHHKEVAFVGCHSAKFDNEKQVALLRQAVLRYNIIHPCFNDSSFTFWKS